jgi:GT2 family glycosyltransferase
VVSSKNPNPRVSVIIVTHNRRDLVLCSVKSVLSDSYEPKSIIVIDDASVDGTATKLRNVFSNRIRVMTNPSAQFLAASRNIGMANSEGRYMLCMDDDCIIPSGNVINELVEVLEKVRNVGAVAPNVHYANGVVAYCGARIFPVYRPMRPTEKSRLLSCDFAPGTIGMYRKEAVEKVNGWDSIYFPFQAEDADLCLRLKESSPLHGLRQYTLRIA